MVSDEIDATYTGKFALVDLEDEVDAVFGELDDLWLDGRSEPAVSAIQIEDALDISLHPRAGVNDAWAKLDLGIEILIVELVVAFEGDPIDDWVFYYLDDQGVTNPA